MFLVQGANHVAKRFRRIFNPRALFALGEVGVWYDPSDLSTMFTDTAGTTPVTAAGQTVALLLDKSKQSTFEARRNLLQHTEELTNIYWNAANVTPSAALGENYGAAFTLTESIDTIDTQHRFGRDSAIIDLGQLVARIKVKPISCTKISVKTRDGNNYSNFVEFDLTTGSVIRVDAAQSMSGTIEPDSDGWFVLTVQKPDISSGIRGRFLIVMLDDAGASSYVGTGRSILVAEPQVGVEDGAYQKTEVFPSTWLGNHATQGTLAARPFYAVVPQTGRRNLLTYSEDFGNAAWTKLGITVSGQDITEDTSTGPHTLSRATLTLSSAVLWFDVKANGRTWVRASSRDPNGTRTFYFDLSTGTSYVSGSSGSFTREMIDLGGGVWRCIIAGRTSSNSTALQIGPTTGNGVSSYTGDGVSGITLYRVQYEESSTATAYQRVVSQYDVTEAGVPSLSYLSFDGVDDCLTTNSVNPNSQSVQVFAGVTKLADPIRGIILSNASDATNGSFSLYIRSIGYGAHSRGSTARFVIASDALAPSTNVVSCLANIASPKLECRVNGILGESTTASQGTVQNYSTNVIHFGRYNFGGGLAFTGHVYSAILRFGPDLDTPTIQQTEAWVGGKTGFNWNNLISQTIYDRFDTVLMDRTGDQILERT
jgi:hypothetical protein